MISYKLYKLLLIVAILIAPPIIFLLLVGKYFPPNDTWAWIFWLFGTFLGWIAFLDNFTTVWLNFRELVGWDLIGQIGKAFQTKTQQTLKNIQDELPVLNRHLDRNEVQEVWKYLNQKRAVLIEGDGGSGKSVIAATIVRQAIHKGIPTLFLDTRNYSRAVAAFGDLEKYVGIKVPLVECLEKLVDEVGHCLLVIDQLDDSIDTPSCQISTDLLIAAAELNRVMVLAVSRTPLDSDEYRPIKNLRFQVVKSEPLDRERASALLREMGVGNPPKRLVALSENLLNLSLVGELVADKVDVKQLNGEIELWEKYTEYLKEREGVDAVQAAIDLAYETFNEGKINFPLPRKQEVALQRLRGRGLIISVGHDLYRFRHEQFLNFFYAQGAIDKNSSPADILDHIAGRRAEEVLVWVLRLYYHRHSPELVIFLKTALFPRHLLKEPQFLADAKNQLVAQKFDLKNIRTLLTEGFTDVELRRLCYDVLEFRPVYEQLAQEMGKDRIIDKLIEYSEQKELIEALLALAEKHNPAKYKERAPYHLAVTTRLAASSSVPVKSQEAEVLTELGNLDFYEKAAFLDEIQMWSDINTYPTELAVILAALTVDNSLERYFFNHLLGDNINWFEVLRERGYLTNPPDPVMKDDKLEYPEWPVSNYLFRVASELPAEVVNIARQIQTANVYVKKQLIWTAQQMLNNYAAEIAQVIQSWSGEELHQLSQEIFRFIIWFLEREEWDAALNLIDIILSPQQRKVPDDPSAHPFWSYPRAVPLSDNFTLEQVSKVVIDILEKHKPLETLNIVIKNIECIVDIEALNGDDYFSHWPETIEPSGQDFGEEFYRLLLIVMAVRMLDEVIQKVPEQGRNILETYLSHHYSIFWRIAIDAIRKHPNTYPDLVNRLFVDDQYLDDHRVYHEYWKFMEATFYLLSESIRINFTNRLFAKIPQQLTGDEEYFHYKRHLRFKQIWAIKEFLSTDEQRQILEELVDQYREPVYPSLRSPSSLSAISVGTISPGIKTSLELTNLPHQELLAELRKKLPYSSLDPDEPDQQGLAHELRTAVATSPQHFASIAPQFIDRDIPPIYTTEILFGFQRALAAGKIFDWEPVLNLCEIVSKKQDDPLENGEPPDTVLGYWQTTHASSRKMVALLLETGVTRDDNATPQEVMPKVRDILLTLLNDLNPSTQYERQYGIEYPFGIGSFATTVIRGRAIQALIEYAVRFARIKTQRQQVEAIPPSSTTKLEPIVKTKLTEKLNKELDPSWAVHYSFGNYFSVLFYLDQEWVVSNLENIFPRQPELLAYWEAAFDGYISHNHFSKDNYEVLKSYYQYAIEQLASDKQLGLATGLAHAGLVKHLGIIYWENIESLEDDSSLIKLFFEIAPDKSRARFITGLQNKLEKTNTEEWSRTKVLLDTRINVIRNKIENDEPYQVLEELRAFAEWIPLIPPGELKNYFDFIELVVLSTEKPEVIRSFNFLASVAQTYTSFVVSLLEKIMRKYEDKWLFVGEDAEIRTILEAAMNSGDSQTKACARQIINLFGERGNDRFRDFLKR